MERPTPANGSEPHKPIVLYTLRDESVKWRVWDFEVFRETQRLGAGNRGKHGH